MTNIFLPGLFIDFVLLIIVIISAVKNKNILPPIRFAAFSAVINTLAYYISIGLNNALGNNIFIYIICGIISKIFIIYIFVSLDSEEINLKAYIYLTITAVSLCVYTVPATGLICEIIILAYLMYSEYLSKSENNKAETHINKQTENSLYLKTIEENYRKSRELWHDLNNHILSMRSLAENKKYDDLEVYINSLSEKISNNAFPVKSGNIILDALIADKYQKARKSEIYVEFEKIDYKNAIEAEDLCVIIGNLFDNAVEENQRGNNSEKSGKYIKVCILSVKNS